MSKSYWWTKERTQKMAKINLRNYCIALGRISKIKKFDNQDGSRKYLITVAVQNDYTNNDGTYGAQFIPLEAFIPKTWETDGIYGTLQIGDLVHVTYSVCNNDYKDANGNKHFGIKLSISHIQYEESKLAKEARRARQDAEKERNMPAPDNFGELAADDYDTYYDQEENSNNNVTEENDNNEYQQ